MLRRTFIQLSGLLPTIPFLPVLPTVEEKDYRLIDYSEKIIPLTYSLIYTDRLMQHKKTIEEVERSITFRNKVNERVKCCKQIFYVVKHRDDVYTIHSFFPMIDSFRYYYPWNNVAFNYNAVDLHTDFLPPRMAALALDAYKEHYI